MPFVSNAYLEAISDQKRNQLYRTTIALGYHPETQDVLALNNTDRYSGMYVLGTQGNGKSALLENLVAADMRMGNAVIVIDPHGDLITHCMAILPPHRLQHAYLLDMEDEAYPFGINVFSVGKLTTSLQATQAVDRIMHIFEVLWPDVLGQQGLPRYLRAATITLLANPGSTLVDMYRLLLDDSIRTSMLKNVPDQSVRDFWKVQYDDVSNAERMRRVQPLVARLESLFMGRSLVRNIVGQRRTTINFRQAIESREVIFLRLPLKTVAQDARLIGTMIMAQIHAAVFSFANVPENQRPGVSVYIDEFQSFSTPDIDDLFTGARKYGIRLTVAHQYRSQLPSYLQASTMSARTKICFQTTPEDARELSHIFPAQEESMKPEDIEAKPVEHLLTYGTDDHYARVLIDTYLRPMQAHKRGGKVDINGQHLTFDLWSGAMMQDLFVSDPTPYLNNLLYQVMRTHNPEVFMPVDAVLGFANCGRGFFTQARMLSNGNKLLAPDAIYPPALVVMGGDGIPRWTRLPENGTEQLYHFLFHLRMTMYHLADEPIGKKSAPSTAIVAQMLHSLPRRTAFVRTGETVGVIYTHDTPKRLEGNQLYGRVQAILTQTRQKYCHPRAAVEQAMMQPNNPQPAPPQVAMPAPVGAVPPVSRWEA